MAHDSECYVEGSNKTVCCFGLRMKENHCYIRSDYTIASLHQIPNDFYRIGCLLFGLLAFSLCSQKLYILNKRSGSSIQRSAFQLMVLASLTFILRAPDPWSHEFIYHPILSGLFSDICSACIYSVVILYTAFYARLVVNPLTLLKSEHYIRGFMAFAFVITWIIFAGVRPIYLFLNDRNIFYSWYILVQLTIAPILLFFMSTAAFYFGFHVHQRLVHISEMNERLALVSSLRHDAWKLQHPDIQLGTNPDVLLGTNPDVQLGTNLDVQLGTNLDVQLGTNPDVQLGTNPDVQLDRNRIQDHPLPIILSFEEDHDSTIMMDIPLRKSTNHRMLVVLVLVEMFSLLTIGLHIWYLIYFIQNGCQLKHEYSCAIGNCLTKSFHFNWICFGLLQYFAIILFYWSFHKTKTGTYLNQ